MAYQSLLIEGTVDVSWVYWGCHGVPGDVIFLDEFTIAVDAFCSTVEDRIGFDFMVTMYNPCGQLDGWGS